MKGTIQEKCPLNAIYATMVLYLTMHWNSTQKVCIKLLDPGVTKQDGAMGKQKLKTKSTKSKIEIHSTRSCVPVEVWLLSEELISWHHESTSRKPLVYVTIGCPDLGGGGGGSGVVGSSLAERPVEDGAPIVLYLFGQLTWQITYMMIYPTLSLQK